MVCKHCGTQNPDSSTFCQGCGAKLGGSGTAGSNGAGGNNSYGGNTAGFNGSTEVMQEITEDSREAITIRTVISTDHSYRTPLLSRKNISQFPCGDILDMNFCFLSRW